MAVTRNSPASHEDSSDVSVTATAIRIAVIAVAYLIAAKVGLGLDALGGFATLVWPASGIALAAILIGGYRLWPAITIGAFSANALAGAPVATALGIAAGNTAEAVAAAYMLSRVPGFRMSLGRPRDVVAFVGLAAVLSTVLSASVGVGSLVASGIIPAEGAAEAWRAWWVGDMIGDLLVAPLILVWATSTGIRPTRGRTLEAVILAAVIVATSLLVFTAGGRSIEATRSSEYLLFPPLIWAALRFGVRGAVTGVAAVATIAIAETSLGSGPFIRPELYQSLFALQTFMGITGATFLILGATISDKKRTEEALRDAREKAEMANKAKAGFLAVVSHELRTPLNAISGYLDLLSLEVEGPLTEKQRRCVDRISQSQQHLLALIEDVIGFAQVEAGRLSFSVRPVAIDDVLESIESIIGAEVRRKGLTLELPDGESGLFVRADPDKLRQVLLNLVSNSVKFTKTGGRVGITSLRAGDRVRISVWDNGIGIPSDQVDRVFDPFYQVDQGDTRRYPGLGLGLSIVRDTVVAMEGQVSLQSVEGAGTTVSVELPGAAEAVTDGQKVPRDPDFSYGAKLENAQ